MLSSVYITYEFWHAASDGWQKAQSFVCRQLFHTSHTWPQQACLEVQASKTTHTRARAPLRGFFHMNFLFPLLTLYGFNSLAQTRLNSPEWQLKSFLLCKRQWYLYFQLFQHLVASICYLNVIAYFEFCCLWMARLGSKHLNAETALILVFDMFTKFNILYVKVMGYRQEYGCYTKEIMRWEMYLLTVLIRIISLCNIFLEYQ